MQYPKTTYAPTTLTRIACLDALLGDVSHERPPSQALPYVNWEYNSSKQTLQLQMVAHQSCSTTLNQD